MRHQRAHSCSEKNVDSRKLELLHLSSPNILTRWTNGRLKSYADHLSTEQGYTIRLHHGRLDL
jgi:hypothetical protein